MHSENYNSRCWKYDPVVRFQLFSSDQEIELPNFTITKFFSIPFKLIINISYNWFSASAARSYTMNAMDVTSTNLITNANATNTQRVRSSLNF